MADFGDTADEVGPPAAYPAVNGGRDPDDSEILDHIQVDSINHGGVRAVAQDALDRERDQETADVLRTMSELDTGDGIYWRISRIGHEDPSMNGHQGTWPDARVTLDNIKDAFGGGIYRCKGFRSTGGYAAHKTIRIAGDAVRKAKPVEATNSGFDVQGFLAQMEARDERRRREERELQERRDAQREKYILTLGPALLTAIGGMFNRPQLDVGALAAAMRPAPGPDALQMIAALKQLAPEPAPAGKDPMATAITLFELLADKAGNNGARADWLDVVKEGVKVLGPSVGGAIEATITQARENAQAQQTTAQNGQAQPNGALPSAALPAPAGMPSAGQLQHAAGEAGMLDLLPHLPWLKAQLAKLAGAAARARDPELYAAMFLEELPAGLTPHRVLELLTRPDWLAQLARFEPAITDATAPWWTQLRDSLLGMIREAAAAAHPARPAPKSVPNVVRPQGVPSLTGEVE